VKTVRTNALLALQNCNRVKYDRKDN